MAHRVHHSLNPRHADHNFGFAFSVWDRLYGTYVHVDANEEIALGVREYVGLAPLTVLGRSLGEPFVAGPFSPPRSTKASAPPR